MKSLASLKSPDMDINLVSHVLVESAYCGRGASTAQEGASAGFEDYVWPWVSRGSLLPSWPFCSVVGG